MQSVCSHANRINGRLLQSIPLVLAIETTRAECVCVYVGVWLPHLHHICVQKWCFVRRYMRWPDPLCGSAVRYSVTVLRFGIQACCGRAYLTLIYQEMCARDLVHFLAEANVHARSNATRPNHESRVHPMETGENWISSYRVGSVTRTRAHIPE